MLGTSDHYSILIASTLDGLLSESGANLEHPFRGREMGSGSAPGLRRRSAQFAAVEVASGSVASSRSRSRGPDLRARSTWSRGQPNPSAASTGDHAQPSKTADHRWLATRTEFWNPTGATRPPCGCS